MGEHVWGLVWLVVLLVGNAFFVGAEFAVISARRSQVEPRAAEGSRAAERALWAMERATLMLATSQLGITICSLLILTVSEPAIHHLLEIPLGLTSISPTAISVIAFLVALFLVTYLHVVLGEMVPKNLSFSVPDRAVLVLAPPLVLVSKVLTPVIWALNGIANGVVRLCGVTPRDEATSTFSLEEVAGIVEQSRDEGTIQDRSGALTGAFEFTDKSVRDVAVPISSLVVLPPDVTPDQVRQAVAEHGFSRFAVSDGQGGARGYLHMKDVMDLPPAQLHEAVPAKRLRRLISVHQDAEVEDALDRMREAGAHLAASVDQDGEMRGMLFLEDVIEVLIGEIGTGAAVT